ncbi:uncharacterized protein PAF06_003910 [Gastrophryne carolinensis]
MSSSGTAIKRSALVDYGRDMSAMGSTGSPSSSAAPLDDQGAGDHQGATADPSTMFRHNSSFYEARCNDHCMHHMCNNMEQENCSVHCCSSNQTCFNAENNIVAPTTVTMTTAAATTTATTITYSDKKCRSFTCSGADCYKNQATVPTKQCRVGITHCELQKKVSNGAVSYEGGCSNTCATSTKSCASITTADCFQECCNATSTACCMMLDGQVHFNTASQINKGYRDLTTKGLWDKGGVKFEAESPISAHKSRSDVK